MRYISELREIVKKTVTTAKQNGKISMFSIASTANVNNREILFPAIRETKTTVCGNALLNSERYLKKIIKEIDGAVDIILVDSETKVSSVINLEIKVKKFVKKSRILTFKPNDLTVDTLDALLAQLKSPLSEKKIAVIGAGNIGSKIALKLVERGANVCITRRNEMKVKKIADGLNAIKSDYLNANVSYTTDNLEASKNADVIIGATPGIPAITTEMVNNMNSNGIIIDVGNGTIFPDAITQTEKKNIRVLCLFMKPGYDGQLETIFETEKLVKNQKKRNLGKFSIISGGIFGKRGDIIVDHVDKPTKILSIADGKGDVISNIDDAEFHNNISIVKKIIKGE